MSTTDSLTDAEREYFDSRGDRAGAVLQENNRSFDTSTSKDRTSGRDRDYSDPAYGFTPGEQHLLKSGGDTSELQRERELPKQLEEQGRRQSWNEYKQLHDFAVQADQDRNYLIDQNARKEERLNLINDAMTPPPTPEQAEEEYRIQKQREFEAKPIFQQVIDIYGANSVLGKAAAALEYKERLETYGQIAQTYARHYSDFPEILQRLVESEAQTIAHLNPGMSLQDVNVELEGRLRNVWETHGYNTPQVLHGMARDRQIFGQGEQRWMEQESRRRQVEHQRAQAEAAEAAHKREREQVRSAIIPLGIHELLYEPKYRHLKELARKHGLSPFNGTGMSSY